MLPVPFLVALALRSLSLVLPQTFFQPDEFYQALEPAHHLVFGYGFLSWEWRDLPETGSDTLWGRAVVGGRMRGWIWPGIYAGVYKSLQLVRLTEMTFKSILPIILSTVISIPTIYWLVRPCRRLQYCVATLSGVAALIATYGVFPVYLKNSHSLLVFAPRTIGVLVAAVTDHHTSLLSAKLLGKGASAGALFLSLTSLFNAHLLPRSLSTSPETMLVTIALVYFPLPSPQAQAPPYDQAISSNASNTSNTSSRSWQNYVMMDRSSEPQAVEYKDSLLIATAAAALAICIRPTTLPLWAYLGIDYLYRTLAASGSAQCARHLLNAATTGTAVLVASTTLDYAITGRLFVPVLTFIHRNVYENLSSFYGSTNPLYHVRQSIPIMLFPIWYWWGQGFASSLLPEHALPNRFRELDRPEGLQILARAVAFAVAVLSLSPHSEWRFLHPFLQALLLFALPPIFHKYRATVFGCYRLQDTIRQYVRFGKMPFYLSLLAPVLPYLYLNIFHGRAQVEVMNALWGMPTGAVTGLVALMPCHSTPWMSHLHKDVPAWFLSCEPPLNVTAFDHVTQQELFYASPVSYIEKVFPYPPVPLHQITSTLPTPNMPSHVILFGSLLDEVEAGTSVRSALRELHYRELWSRWNGFDLVQDEALRRGGVRIWQKLTSDEI